MLLSDEVPALLKLYDANILGFSLEVVLEPTIAWTGNTEDRHVQPRIGAIIDDVLRERLIPCVSRTNGVPAAVRPCIYGAVERANGRFVLQKVAVEPLVLNVSPTLQEILGQALHLMEGEPPGVRIVLVDLVAERVVLRQQWPFEKLFIRTTNAEKRERSVASR